MEEKKSFIPCRLKNAAVGGHVAGTEDIYDDGLEKDQQEINAEVRNKLISAEDSIEALNEQVAFEGKLEVANTAAEITDNGGKVPSVKAVSEALKGVGYFECNTAASTANKTIAATGYSLRAGGCIKIKMINANTADNATLTVGSTAAKPLFYGDERASAGNTWETGEVIEVYYDPSYNSNTGAFYASNAQGDGGKAEKIKYDNSQSGLASANVQGAIDRLADNSDTVMNTLGMTKVVDVHTMTSNKAVSTYTYPIHAGDKFIVEPFIGSGVLYVTATTRRNGSVVEYVLNKATTNDDVEFVAIQDADEFAVYSSGGSSSVSVKQIKETGIVKRVFESDMQIVNGVWVDKQNGVFVPNTDSQLGFLPLSGYNYVKVEGVENSAIAFVTSNSTSGSIPYSTKYPYFINIGANTETYPIPQDAAYLIVLITYSGYAYYVPKSIELTIGIPISYRVDELEKRENEVFNQVRIIEGTPLLRFMPQVNTTTWHYVVTVKTYIVKVPEGSSKIKMKTWNRTSIVYLQDNYTLPSGTSDVTINGICASTSVVTINEHSTYISEIPSDCAYIGVVAYYSSGGQIKDGMPLFMGFSDGRSVVTYDEIDSIKHDVLANPLSCYVFGDSHATISNKTIDKSTIYWPVVTRTRHEGALGKYYMYFCEDHVNNSPIYMAYSDDMINWTNYGVVATSTNQLGSSGDIETPAIIWDDMNDRYLLFYHSSTIDKAGTGYAQTSYISESEDGISWTYLKPFTTMNKSKFCGNFHNGYIRIDKIGNLLFAHGLIGGGDAGLSTRYYSFDGVNWLINPNQTGTVISMCKPVTQGETTDLREIVLQTGSYLNINGHNYITYLGGTNGSGTSSRVLNVFLQEVLDDWFTPAGKALRMTTEELNLRSVNTFVDDNGDVYYLVVNSITGSTSSQNYMVILISKLTRI